MIHPLAILLVLLGAAGIPLVLKTFTPGGWRRAMVSLLIAVCMTPALVVGHGVGITLAIFSLLFPWRAGHWEPGEVAAPLLSIVVVWAVAFGASSLVPRSPASPSRRRERIIVLASAAALVALAAVSMGFRQFARDHRATYGPIVVTVDTGDQKLADIVVQLSCGMVPAYQGSAVIESGKPHEFPPQYLPDLRDPFDCTVLVAHPLLAPRIQVSFPDIKPAPRTRIELPVIPAPPWSDDRYQRIARGEEIPPNSETVPPLRRAEIALYDDWIELAIRWVPPFCKDDFARIQATYLDALAQRRQSLFDSQGAPSPPADARQIVLEGWRQTCKSHAGR